VSLNRPAIETERLLLRPFSTADLDDWADSIFADPDVTRYLPKRDILPHQRAERALKYVQEHWARHGFGLWAVTERTSGQFIGQGGLNYLEETGEVEVDYALAKVYWGRGIATETAQASLRFGFEVLGLERIIGLAMHENIASRRVLERTGMLFVKDTHLFGLDLVNYAILQEQFRVDNSRFVIVSDENLEDGTRQ
jgi:ribosomal-protein-alanine N-acetyltransferase